MKTKKGDLNLELFFFLILTIAMAFLFFSLFREMQLALPDNDKLFVYETIRMSDNYTGNFEFNYTSPTLAIDVIEIDKKKGKIVIHPMSKEINFLDLNLTNTKIDESYLGPYNGCILFRKFENKLMLTKCKGDKVIKIK
jgi:hypothetical protein